MNQKRWDGLAKQDQQAIQRAAASSYQRLGALMDSSFASMVADMKRDGVSIRTLTSQEVEAWKNQSRYQQVQADWVNARQAEGVKDMAPTLRQVTAIMDNTMKN
jgi:TRAP-type C4-dicarboxylate transport system substrate-binding protein